MAWDAITEAEIQPDQPVIGEDGFGRKVKDNLDYLYGQIGSGAGLPPNGSFEIDSDSDGVPDQWTRSLYPGGSGAFETTSPAHGANAYKFVHPGGSGNGGGYLESDYIEVTQLKRYILAFIHWASVAGMKNMVVVRCFDKSKVDLSLDQTLYNSTSNPTAATYFLRNFTPPANTRYIKVRLIGGYTDTDVAGTIYFDRVSFEDMPQWIFESGFSMGEVTTNSTSYVDVASVTLCSTYAHTMPFDLRFSAEIRHTAVGGTTYIRFRVGSTYSNEVSNTGDVWTAFDFRGKYNENASSKSVQLVMQLATSNPTYAARGRKAALTWPEFSYIL